MLPFLFTLIALAAPEAPPADLMALLALDLWQDEVRADPDDIHQRYVDLCEGGDPIACLHRRWYSSRAPDLHRAADQLRTPCKEGSLEACVVVGWSKSQVRPGVQSSQADDPEIAARLFSSTCERGLTRGCAELGWLHLIGAGVEQDRVRALSLLGQACEQGIRPACGGAAEASPDFDEAARWLKKGLPHPSVRISYARFLERAKRPERAREHYLKACNADAPTACTQAARLSTLGAEALLEQACAQQDGDGCGGLAELALANEALVMAQARAEEGCSLDSARSCAALANTLLLKADKREDLPGDVNSAHRMRAKACRLGSGPACFLIGRGDPHHGTPLIERSCKLGHGEACDMLLAIYLHEDPPRLREILDRSEPLCEEGNGSQCLFSSTAWWQLGPEHIPMSVGLWESACEAGSGLGCGLVGRSHEFGITKEANSETALQIYRDSCDDEDAGYTCTELAHTHLRKDPLDLDPAEDLYVRGCEGGDAAACRSLVDLRRGQGHSDKSVLHLLQGACFLDNGYAEMCLEYERLVRVSGEPRSFTRGNAALLRACSMGYDAACPTHRRVARWPWAAPTGPMLDAERTCHLKDDEACWTSVARAVLGNTPESWLLEEYAHLLQNACLIDPTLCHFEAAQETLSARSLDLLERACFEGGHTESCMAAALIYDQGLAEPPTPRHVLDLASRACTTDLDDEPHCWALPTLMERWPGGPVETTRTLVALCETVAPSACHDAGMRVLQGTGYEVVFRLPELGWKVNEAKIHKWQVKHGTQVAVDQVLCTVSTTNSEIEIPTRVPGTIRTLHGKVDALVRVGAPLVTMLSGYGDANTALQLFSRGCARDEFEACKKIQMAQKAASQGKAQQMNWEKYDGEPDPVDYYESGLPAGAE